VSPEQITEEIMEESEWCIDTARKIGQTRSIPKEQTVQVAILVAIASLRTELKMIAVSLEDKIDTERASLVDAFVEVADRVERGSGDIERSISEGLEQISSTIEEIDEQDVTRNCEPSPLKK